MSWLTTLRDRLRSHTSAPTGRAVDGIPWRGQPLLDYSRRPEPGWQAALDAASAKGDQVSRLYLAWVPGDPWQPIHRWFVFQLQPWQHVPDAFKTELEGPHPRTDAQLVYQPRVVDGKLEHRPLIKGGPCRLIDRVQWVLHRQVLAETGERTFARYFWVIQGDHGGHPYQLPMEEQKLRREQGLPEEFPMAGDAPYAPFDGRVIEAMQRYDLWRYAHGQGADALVTAPARAQIARLNDAEREAHRLLWARWGALTDEIADGLAHAARQDGLHYHRVPSWKRARPIDLEAVRDRFVNDVSIDLQEVA
jgi:hypothetical protein